jgi:hypothetical protein
VERKAAVVDPGGNGIGRCINAHYLLPEPADATLGDVGGLREALSAAENAGHGESGDCREKAKDLVPEFHLISALSRFLGGEAQRLDQH